jgi:putative polyhydroxyalkanoate system protein
VDAPVVLGADPRNQKPKGAPRAMAKIHIRRKHNLGLTDAKTQVEGLANRLQKELNAKCQWQGDRLLFKRTGATGAIDVGEDFIEVDITLGMALAMMKGKIEDAINQKLDASINSGGPKTA